MADDEGGKKRREERERKVSEGWREGRGGERERGN